MSLKVDDILPSAVDISKKIPKRKQRRLPNTCASRLPWMPKKKALLDKLKGPSGVSDEERLKRAAAIINRAVNNGLTG